MKMLRLTALLIAAALVAACGQMPRAPATPLEQIEAAEITAQEVSASIVNLTCTKFVKQQCVEPGKAFSPKQGIAYHAEVQKVRDALKVATGLRGGDAGTCLGAQRNQVACIAAARGLLAELETRVLQAQAGGKP